MRIFASILTSALLSIPAAGVFSQDMMYGTGLYVSGGGGVSLITSMKDVVQSEDLGSSSGSEAEADWTLAPGFVFGGAVGYDFGDLRAEGEFSYQAAGFRHDYNGDIDDNNKADDSLAVIGIMANGYFDLDTGTPFVPYIGVGVGAVNLSVNLAPGEDEDPTFEGNGWGFGYLVNLGLGYQIINEFALTLGYKFSGTLETEVTDVGKNGSDTEDDDRNVKPTLMAHRFELGVKVTF